MSEKTKVELTDQALKDIVGGAKTGDVKNNKVYITFPAPYTFMSKYYGVQDVEDLATQFYAYKDLIKEAITDSIKQAIINLYQINGATMSDTVCEFLGILAK